MTACVIMLQYHNMGMHHHSIHHAAISARRRNNTFSLWIPTAKSGGAKTNSRRTLGDPEEKNIAL
jgi:hypothetical protein